MRSYLETAHNHYGRPLFAERVQTSLSYSYLKTSVPTIELESRTVVKHNSFSWSSSETIDSNYRGFVPKASKNTQFENSNSPLNFKKHVRILVANV